MVRRVPSSTWGICSRRPGPKCPAFSSSKNSTVSLKSRRHGRRRWRSWRQSYQSGGCKVLIPSYFIWDYDFPLKVSSCSIVPLCDRYLNVCSDPDWNGRHGQKKEHVHHRSNNQAGHHRPSHPSVDNKITFLKFLKFPVAWASWSTSPSLTSCPVWTSCMLTWRSLSSTRRWTSPSWPRWWRASPGQTWQRSVRGRASSPSGRALRSISGGRRRNRSRLDEDFYSFKWWRYKVGFLLNCSFF